SRTHESRAECSVRAIEGRSMHHPGRFRRLYRQRNIVVHGGNTAAIALDSALRTAAPLIGAGLDRLVHAQLIKHVEPLDLAARAENSLALVSDPLGPDPTKLLE